MQTKVNPNDTDEYRNAPNKHRQKEANHEKRADHT